ncbi:helix-turn-helix domain-containing protein [Nibribacter ruber]|uniref:Helix-turn-helix domain-containing protein n=1 Tax=Nibribacter ruber TaxID=2698458 RepID=A0A6P1NVU9_9BACT|nr:AraC family transcriptional regulator [Nibribacter ruber]QHL87966.1 helix-turn-helix domain-containing protein [Nibribacter ruber]
MVCPRCIRIIKDQFALLHLPVNEVRLGQVDLDRPLNQEELERVKSVMAEYGFELLEDRKGKLVEQIKTLLIEAIHYQEEKISANYSTYLAQAIGKDYSTLSHVFSSMENVTIERYIILQKVEYIKAELDYEELSLGEIAARLHYSSLSHLSKQFKAVTGYSPSEYRKLQIMNRLPLDQVT